MNIHDSRLYPKIDGCEQVIDGVNSLRTVVEWYLPGSKAQTYFTGGEYNFNNGNSYQLEAENSYKISLELWDGNTAIARDFSVVAWGEKD